MGGQNLIGWSDFDEMMTDALNLIGEGRIKIELTDEQRKGILRRTILWYGAFKAPKRLAWYPARGNNIYDMNDDTDVILEVVTTPLSEELFEMYGGGTGYSILYDPLPIAIFRGDYSYVLQILQDVEMGKRIMSADINWEYDRVTKKLYVYPSGAYYNIPPQIAVFYLSNQLDFKDVEMLDQDLLFRKIQAESKMTVGLMRRKYAEWPGPAGQVTMDGDALVSEASEERRELDEELAGRARPCGFVVG